MSSRSEATGLTQDRAAVFGRPILGLRRREQIFHLVLVTPAVLVTAALVAWPIYQLFYISLHDLRLPELMRAVVKLLTLSNYEKALGHLDLPRVMWNTFVFTFAGTGAAFVLGLASALALNAQRKGRAVLQTIVISPWGVAPVVAAVIWMLLLDERLGLVNAALKGAGVITAPIPFLTSPDWAMAAITLVAVWKEYPFFTVMLLAALQSIPRELYEAARMDGAGALRQFTAVTWPLTRPVAAVATFLALLSAFRNVETVLVLTGGGPARATETLAVRVYTETFRFLSPGTGAALGVLTLFIAVAFAAVMWRFMRERPR